jgi:hypothetical protein
MGIQNQQQQLQQRAALAPLQQQEAQNTVAAGNLDLQQKQLQQKDQQALSATMQQWGKTPAPAADGTQPPAKSAMPSYDDLVPLAIKNGASFQAVQGLQAHILDMKTKAATIAMDDARAGASNADSMKANNGMIVDALTGAINAPDAQLPQAIAQTAQELAQKKLLDPQHIQMAQQIAQQAASDPSGARQQLNLYANSLGGFSKLLDEAQKKVQVQQEQGKSDPTSPFYSPSEQSVAMGTAPGAAQIQQGKVQQAAKVAGAEEGARLPGEMALARQRQALSQGDPGAAAQLLVNGDATLSELKSRGATPEFIANTLAAAHKLSNGQYNAQSADAQFQVAKSPANVAFFGSAKSLTDKGGTLDQLAATAKNIPGNQIPAFNSIADWEKAATGSGPIAKFAAQALGVADDYSKVMGGGQGSDTSRLQALKIIAANQSPEQRAGAIEGIRGAVGSQLNSRIGANPVLQRMYGSQQQAAPQMIRATDPQGVLHEAPAGTPLPQGWKAQ